MARRLLRGGHQVIGYNRTPEVTQQLVAETGLTPAWSLEQAVALLVPPRAVWIMVPAGEVTEEAVVTLAGLLAPGDTLIDGGNSNFNDTMRRAKQVAAQQLHFIDVGTSGGIWGLAEGYSLMIGGEPEAVERLRPVFATLAPAPDRGWGHVGPSGAGHFTKMVHNGIEYGMMEAFAEGFELMRARAGFALDLHQVAEIWRYGSVVRSWLLDLAASALKEDPNLEALSDWVADSGEGRWTVHEAIDQAVPAPVIALSLFRRFESRQDASFAGKLLAAMRHQFGGHEVKREG
jgi:6-phosphogluconate dehydrogenase